MVRYDDSTSLPLLLHLNSEPWLNRQAYATAPALNAFPIRQPADRCVNLPPAMPTTATNTTLAYAIAARRSCRSFERRELSLAVLSRLLALTYGIQGVTSWSDGTCNLQRPLPSAGGLYPLELYLCLTNVTDISDGVYRFEPLHHRLEPKAALPHSEDLACMLLAQPFVDSANIVVFLVASYRRTMEKYGMRGYRYLLLEAGHVAQNFCLLSAEAGLGTLCIGGFQDHLINAWLRLDERDALTLYGMAAGWPSPAKA